MGSYFDAITDEQADLLAQTKLFFVASADPALALGPHGIGPVNVSPRGGVPLHLLSRTRVAFLDYPGSGNETARHALAGGPVTLMACSFDGEDAAVVRLYGRARVTPLESSPLAEKLLGSPAEHLKGPRQVIEIDVERTSTSCGYGVPVMAFGHDREREERGRRYKPKG